MKLHDKLAADVVGLGNARVACPKCGKKFDASNAAIAGYFATGWPECCGQTAMFEVRP